VPGPGLAAASKLPVIPTGLWSYRGDRKEAGAAASWQPQGIGSRPPDVDMKICGHSTPLYNMA
jgi:hypothetical protein